MNIGKIVYSAVLLGIMSVLFFTSCVHEHNFGEWKTIKDPTCIDVGIRERKCTCGNIETEEIPLLEHDYGSFKISIKPTCSQPGEKERICKVCGCKDIAETPIDESNHSFCEWATVINPSCTEKGLQERSCNWCNKRDERAISAEGHSFTAWSTVRETSCSTEGKKERSCAKCGFSETQTIKKSEHQYGDWHIADNMLCTSAGAYVIRVCSGCGEKQTMEIHDHHWEGATCTKPEMCTYCGIQTGYPRGHWLDTNGKCTRCHELVVTGVALPPFPIVCTSFGKPVMRMDSIAYSFDGWHMNIDFVGEKIAGSPGSEVAFYCELVNQTAGGTYIRGDNYFEGGYKVGDTIRGRLSIRIDSIVDPCVIEITINDYQN